jgi:hypothetical protein
MQVMPTKQRLLYPPDFDELYKEWEAHKQSKGQIPDNKDEHPQHFDELNREDA